jgi:hypothetical protein
MVANDRPTALTGGTHQNSHAIRRHMAVVGEVSRIGVNDRFHDFVGKGRQQCKSCGTNTPGLVANTDRHDVLTLGGN